MCDSDCKQGGKHCGDKGCDGTGKKDGTGGHCPDGGCPSGGCGGSNQPFPNTKPCGGCGQKKDKKDD
ncbi:hypothetical protein A2531_04400 [Candidatus Falkowbacteria bacterium RIFOXYD2_FULL_34_120]|uniref:Uncharacterized protein n=1 Tax=Candidatus Falkowbacteria bacterium RIFOXYD2_FULL_34_120 TaxID=1798007 RepID=A0A1F5TQ65_9BACT|nr:MAG: hypothetical protein A2466_01350 [Candidatus Falkowbacteria bacterium RIFOXYC2_FULL_34_220]OGF38662.1 MAG: hypothetical protein A2515_04935 [Candidatus Falkowbacteria bacterium RIFOXYD12_FULL_34_57]OGF40979.1 MAG: hypothetical protein A2531_04400 [Candidatus Falkowbacteria bacterium RIFOXYD2_FULL_34_120]